ncbi:uncharacterized protein [Argopecten irradians]|uniref:uncharacterized protein n=1 Tax=Argopecten irradians TaxID=31199 RepID=UPI00371B51AC
MTSMCLMTTTTPAPVTYNDPSQYSYFLPAMTTCGGSLPLVNSDTTANDLTSAMAGSPGRCFNCPGTLVAGPSPLTLYSDNWPNVYQRYASCSCLFMSNKVDYKIQLNIGDMNIESCCDKLLVYDGPDSTSAILGDLRGQTTGVQTINSSTDALYIEFRSDLSVQYSGFSIVYTEVSPDINSSVPLTITPPPPLSLWVWVLGQIDEEAMIWTQPDGTPMSQTPIMYPNLAYLFDYFNDTGNYYNGVPFTDYRICLDTNSHMKIGVDSTIHRCHVTCTGL